MKCLTDKTLRALIDQEVTDLEREDANRHLKGCAECRARLEHMSREGVEVGSALASLAPQKMIDAPQAFERFQARVASEGDVPERRSVLGGFFSAHPFPAWSALATAVLIIVLITFAPARSWTQRVLAMLRVEKVTVVPVDLNFTPNRDTQALIRQVISDEVTVTLSAGKPQLVADASQASQMVDFKVRSFTNVSESPKIGVEGEQAYTMKLDQSRLQAILNSLGRPDLQVPESINGQSIAVHIPKSVLLRYGSCPERSTSAQSGRQSRSLPSESTGCTLFAQIPSPIVSVPPELDVEQLFQIALQAAGMSSEQARSFCSTVDWKSTLVVPIPRRANSYVQEQVDGVEGDLIMGKAYPGRPAEYTLIWVKKGIIYSIHGFGRPDEALALADSLS